jgi:hypothetical protein
METDKFLNDKVTDRSIKLNGKNKDILTLGESFIKSYNASREGLKKLGIIRTNRALQSDYAEWLVVNFYDLKLAPTTINKGYDAKDDTGVRYEIKCRIVKNLYYTAFSFKEKNIKNKSFDIFYGVFFNEDLELLGIIKTSYTVVNELCKKNQNRLSFRWNKKISKDARIKKMIWNENFGDEK